MNTSRMMSLQYLRAIAATFVVFHHAANVGSSFLESGVDIFFIISGFIMYRVARNDRIYEFLIRRFLRIAPMYWLATVLLFCISISLHPDRISYQIFYELLQSFMFVPHYSLYNPTVIEPYLWVGWTLNYEMFFYGIFALSLGTDRSFAFITITLSLLVISGALFQINGAIWSTYTNPLLLEFLMGVIIAKNYDSLKKMAIYLFFAVFLVLLSDLSMYIPRVVSWGLPSAALIIGTLALEKAKLLPHFKCIERIGDASFSIYLFQGFGLAVGQKLYSNFSIENIYFKILFQVVAVAFAFMIGFFIHLLIEKPILTKLSKMQYSFRSNRTISDSKKL